MKPTCREAFANQTANQLLNLRHAILVKDAMTGRFSRETAQRLFESLKEAGPSCLGPSSPIQIASAFGRHPEWMSFSCSSETLSMFPLTTNDARAVASTMSGERLYDDHTVEPGLWDGDPREFSSAARQVLSLPVDWVALEIETGPFIIRWIDEKWLRRAPLAHPNNNKEADCAAETLVDMISKGAAKPVQQGHWTECLSRAGCSDEKLFSVFKAMLSCGWISDVDGGLPVHEFAISNAVSPRFSKVCSWLAEAFPQTLNALDKSRRTPLFIINQRLAGGYLNHCSETLADAFEALAEAGADPCTIVQNIPPVEAANHRRIAACVERHELSGSLAHSLPATCQSV